jgi:hypothetical protein
LPPWTTAPGQTGISPGTCKTSTPTLPALITASTNLYPHDFSPPLGGAAVSADALKDAHYYQWGTIRPSRPPRPIGSGSRASLCEVRQDRRAQAPRAGVDPMLQGADR